MRKTVIAIMLMSMVMVTACGSDVESVKKTALDAPARSEEEVSVEEEEKEDQEEVIYSVGDRIVFDDKYALTIVGITETDERNEFSEKEVEQVLIIEYQYENLNSDEEIYISEMEFKLVDEGGNMMDTYPVEAYHMAEYTPKGTKTLASFAVGTTAKSGSIVMHYYDNFFSSESDCSFSLVVGETAEVNLDGGLPEFGNTFKLGEIIEVTTEEGNYTITIDEIRKTDERNEYENRKPEAVYEIIYTFSNISMDSTLYIDDYSFTLIDEYGNTGYSYPNYSDIYPSETVKGARSTAVMYQAAHKDSDKILLSYKDNMFNMVSDFFILLDEIS
ncbi:MAG TPA: hypothetical protein VLM88_05060 [Proteiniclasticum sp.]|nr:hypothetical protein [Proteiniclasticum sp.]